MRSKNFHVVRAVIGAVNLILGIMIIVTTIANLMFGSPPQSNNTINYLFIFIGFGFILNGILTLLKKD